MNSLSAPSRAVADRFLEAWLGYPGMPTPPPDIDTFLGAGPVTDRLALFHALLRTDLEQRLRHGLTPSIRYYLKCFPEHSDEIRNTFDAPFVMDRLGRGGMGEVYRGFDFVARRPMAIKMIRTPLTADADTADAVSLQRFYAEARAISALHHPNIVQTYSVGHLEGVPYLCLELVEGGSLAARVKEGPREPRQAALLLEALALGVQHAHEHGIIHRDLKPANVLIAADGTPKVTDFGLAKLSDDSCALTHSGAVMGTPEYMAPEQAEGRTNDIGPAADVWGLGGILYALLTGRPPFRAEGRESLRDVLRKVCQEAPLPPRAINPAAEGDLEVICLKCLEKRPTDRYRSAQELAADLRRFLYGEAIHARPIGLPGRVWRWGLKNKGIAVAGAALLLLLPATLLFAMLTWLLFTAVGQSQQQVAQQGKGKVLAEIDGLQHHADVLLEEARKASDTPQALARIGEAVELREQVQDHLARLSSPEPGFLIRQQELWQQRWIGLRNEATRRLTRTDLRPVRTVTLPGLTNDEPRLGGAISPDGAWFVLGYAWDQKLRIVHSESGDTRTLTFPQEVPRPNNVFGGLGSPTLAVSPRGDRIAVLYPMADELVVIAPSGDAFRTYPLHPQMGRTSTLFGDTVRFPEADAVEVNDSRGTWRLQLSEGKWSLPAPGRPPLRPLPGLGPVTTQRIIDSSEFRVVYDPANGLVLACIEGGSPRLLWRDVAPSADSPEGERCQDMRFGTDPRQVYLLTTRRLLFVNAATGTRAEIALNPGSNTVTRQVIFPCRTGLALLRQDRNDRLEVTFVAGAAAVVPVQTLSHPAAVRALDLSSNGQLVTAANRQVHVWHGQRPLRSLGVADTGSRPGSFGWNPSLRNGVPWWGFLPGPRARLVIERREAPPPGLPFPGHDSLTRTEVYDSDDGRLLHTFPAQGVGRIVRGSMPFPQSVGVSPDRRLAVVVAAENGDSAELEVWSLEECKPLARLGRHNLTQNGHPAALNLIFSPQGRWLITVALADRAALLLGKPATTAVSVWRLPEGKRMGEIAFPARAGGLTQLSCQFESQERRGLLTETQFGNEGTASGSPAWVIDLEAGKRHCVLDEFDTLGAGGPLHFAGDRVVVPSRSSFGAVPGPARPPGLTEHPCRVWRLDTGKHYNLGQPWATPPRIEISPDGRRALLQGIRKIEGGLLGGFASRTSDVQLWDLTEPKLLREAALALGGQIGFGREQTTLFDPPVAGDHEHVYLAQQPDERGLRPKPVVWRWSDGTTVASPDRRLLAASAAEGWLLWERAGKPLLTDRIGGTTVELQQTTGTELLVRLSPDRQTAFLSGRSGPVADQSGFWELRTGRLLARLPAEHEFVGFESTGRWAVVRDRTRGLQLVDLRGGLTQRLELPLELDPHPLPGVGGTETRPAIQVRSDGTRLALPIHGTVHLWDVAANQPVGQVRTGGHAGAVLAVAQHAGTQRIASAGDDRIVYLWERQSERPVRQMIGHTGPITAVAFRPDGEAVASASEDGSVVLWRTTGGQLWSSPVGVVRCLTFPAHGRFLACGTVDGRILLLDPDTGAVRFKQPTDGSEVKVLAFSRGGEVLASGTTKGQVGVWSSDKPDALGLLRRWDTDRPVTALSWLPTRNVLLTGSDAVHFWEMRSAEGSPPCVWTLGTSHPPVRGLAVSESGRELYVADEGGQVARFDLAELSNGLRRWNLEVPGLFGTSP